MAGRFVGAWRHGRYELHRAEAMKTLRQIRGVDFELRLAQLWIANYSRAAIAEMLTAEGWPVDGKGVRYYATKLALEPRRSGWQYKPSAGALSEQERAIFIKGLDELGM